MPSARAAALALSLIAAISPGLAACGDEVATTTQSATTTDAAAARPTALRVRFERQIREVLERQGDDLDADCVIERLDQTLSNATVALSLKAIERGDEVPSEAVDAAFEAGRDCAAG